MAPIVNGPTKPIAVAIPRNVAVKRSIFHDQIRAKFIEDGPTPAVLGNVAVEDSALNNEIAIPHFIVNSRPARAGEAVWRRRKNVAVKNNITNQRIFVTAAGTVNIECATFARAVIIGARQIAIKHRAANMAFKMPA